jgi:aminobenzoyl-glutamate utilization protein B
MIGTKAGALALALLMSTAAGSALAAQSYSASAIKALKAKAVAGVESRAKLSQVMNDQIFSFGELGFQEVETSKYITGVLEENGFKVTRGVAGLPTGWTATWTNGTGGPVIALGSDIDCIPKASQKPGVPWHDPIVPGAPGHGEGHNSGQALNVVAALALKDLMIKENIAGTLMLWPGVAEELVAGKAYMVRDGVFKDVDATIFTHVGSNLQTSWGPSIGTGLVSVKYSFHGESAHSAGAPWRGRSALDAVELMDMGWNMRREHLRPEQRSHSVITDGGDQPNVVPSEATIWYYFREQTFDAIKKNYAIGNKIAQAAADMTDTTVDHMLVGTAAPRYYNKPDGRGRPGQYPGGRPAPVDAGRAGLRQGCPDQCRLDQEGGPGRQAEGPDRAGAEAGKRRLGRHRRHLVDHADDHDQLSVQHSRSARPPLGQRHLDGHADRPQGRGGRLQGGGDDGAGSLDPAQAAGRLEDLVQGRPDQGSEVRADAVGDRQAADPDQRQHHGDLSAGDDEVLLRPRKYGTYLEQLGIAWPVKQLTPPAPAK